MPFKNEKDDPISERQLVREAGVHSSAREKLREALLPHVVRATKEFMRSRGIPEQRQRELIEVGMEPFDRVFNIYLKNAATHHEYEGYFYEYYVWWMRKAISEYLHKNT